jgi:hypothetical protein
MGHQSLVYGVIEVFSCNSEVDRINRKALEELPENDAVWPYLLRSMFNATFNEKLNVQYGFQVIHFGASYKEIEYDWDDWLRKFEMLLSSICGVSAIVHLHTEQNGKHTYEWVGTQLDSFMLNQPSTWEFLGGIRQFADPRAGA